MASKGTVAKTKSTESSRKSSGQNKAKRQSISISTIKEVSSSITTSSIAPSDHSSGSSIRKDQRYYNIITPTRFKQLQRKAEDAVKTQKTFILRAHWPIVRKAFLNRGWIELLEAHYNSFPHGVSGLNYLKIVRNLPVARDDETLSSYIARCERYVLSRLIEHLPVSFTWSWVPNKVDFDHQSRHPNMIVNKLMIAPFVTKEGLAHDLQKNLIWLAEENFVKVNHPRSYRASDPEEWHQFVQNFRLTACISFLKYVVEKSNATDPKIIFGNSAATDIPYSAFEFALARCYELVNFFKHNDIDLNQRSNVTDSDWNMFFEHHNSLIRTNARINSKNIPIESILRNAKVVLELIKPFWPEYNTDGYLNIWIVKPANDMCGNGIQITKNLKKIENLVNSKAKTRKRMIIQKYIESPLTIYNTKFDIRQYFLVTNINPLVIWLYKECYLRFSSRPYSLEDFHESIHVTNHAVQSRYGIDPKRDERLPRQNMWDCYTFQAYLRQIGKGDLWDSVIYPGIKHAVIGTVLASQSNMVQRDNTHQLFGADFILDEEFKPWLLEVNGCPNLSLSTNITARMVPQCIEDLMKVVVDRKQNPLASTGNFEQIYTQPIQSTVSNKNLVVSGKQFDTAYKARREMYQHLAQSSLKIDPKSPIKLANPINLKTTDISPSIGPKKVRISNVDQTPIEKTSQSQLEDIKRNLKKITKGA